MTDSFSTTAYQPVSVTDADDPNDRPSSAPPTAQSPASFLSALLSQQPLLLTSSLSLNLLLVLALLSSLLLPLLTRPPEVHHPPPSPTRLDLPLTPVALCLALKDQRDDLLEWLAWHQQLAGIQRFYIYDNIEESRDTRPIRRLLQPLIDEGVVEYIAYRWDGTYLQQLHPHQQHFVYNSCVHSFGWRHDWIGIIDADEFIEYEGLRWKQPLAEILRPFEQPHVGAVAFNWRMFGNPNQTIRVKPEGGSVRGFVHCLYSKMVKAFVRPMFAAEVEVHLPALQDGSIVVGESMEEITEERLTWGSHQRVWVNHYYSRSVQQNAEKCQRDSKDHITKRDMQTFVDFDAAVDSVCESARDILDSTGLTW